MNLPKTLSEKNSSIIHKSIYTISYSKVSTPNWPLVFIFNFSSLTVS